MTRYSTEEKAKWLEEWKVGLSKKLCNWPPVTVSGKTESDVIITNVIFENKRRGGFLAYFRRNSFSEGLLMHEMVSTIIPALNRTSGSSSRTENRIKRELGL
jgi:hypothetical protein